RAAEQEVADLIDRRQAMRSRIRAVAGRRSICRPIRIPGLAIGTLHGDFLLTHSRAIRTCGVKKQIRNNPIANFAGAAQRKASNLSQINRMVVRLRAFISSKLLPLLPVPYGS